MRILWLKSDLLFPLDTGGKLRTWHLMRHLAERHAITYLGFAEPGAPGDRPSNAVEEMRAVAARVETVPLTNPAKGSMRSASGKMSRAAGSTSSCSRPSERRTSCAMRKCSTSIGAPVCSTS